MHSRDSIHHPDWADEPFYKGFKPQFRIEVLPSIDNKFRLLCNGQEIHGVESAHVDVRHGGANTHGDQWRITTLTLELLSPVEQVECDYSVDDEKAKT
jgi:hypothetical protein